MLFTIIYTINLSHKEFVRWAKYRNKKLGNLRWGGCTLKHNNTQQHRQKRCTLRHTELVFPCLKSVPLIRVAGRVEEQQTSQSNHIASQHTPVLFIMCFQIIVMLRPSKRYIVANIHFLIYDLVLPRGTVGTCTVTYNDSLGFYFSFKKVTCQLVVINYRKGIADLLNKFLPLMKEHTSWLQTF